MTEFEFKVETVKELQVQLSSLIEKSRIILKNLEDKGVDANFSINSDLLFVAQKIHSLSAILGYMKHFGLTLRFDDVSLDKEQDPVCNDSE